MSIFTKNTESSRQADAQATSEKIGQQLKRGAPPVSNDTLRFTAISGGASSFQWENSGYQSVCITINNAGASPTQRFAYEVSNNAIEWIAMSLDVVATTSGEQFLPYLKPEFTAGNFGTMMLAGNVISKFSRIRGLAVTVPSEIIIERKTNVYVPKPFDLTNFLDASSEYTSAGQITSTTAVQLKAASSAAVRYGVAALTVKNNGTGSARYNLHELSPKVDLFNLTIGPNETQHFLFPSPKLTAGGKSVNFALESATNVSIEVNATIVKLFS